MLDKDTLAFVRIGLDRYGSTMLPIWGTDLIQHTRLHIRSVKGKFRSAVSC